MELQNIFTVVDSFSLLNHQAADCFDIYSKLNVLIYFPIFI